jgi:hypothetical protein
MKGGRKEELLNCLRLPWSAWECLEDLCLPSLAIMSLVNFPREQEGKKRSAFGTASLEVLVSHETFYMLSTLPFSGLVCTTSSGFPKPRSLPKATMILKQFDMSSSAQPSSLRSRS